MNSIFSQMDPGESLDHFHQRCVVPTPGETSRRNNDIDQFMRFLHSEFGQRPFTVKEVVKSGSLGKGTAVRGSADIDLVVFLNGLSSIEDLKDNRRTLLDKLQGNVQSYRPWQGRIQLNKRTSYFLSYWLDGQEMDILPAYDVLSREGTAGAVYQRMRSYPQGTEQAAQQFSVSLAPLQIRFVKPLGEDVKRVIRLVKLWKQERDMDITSYTVELITIHASRKMGSGVTTNALFKEVMQLLKDCRALRIAFDDNYHSQEYIRSLRPPYVLDPANPYMNTIEGVPADDVSREAARTLRLL